MNLFILESIGTSELILIGIIALIVFGPRKLPQMAKTLGKMMAEFRGATNEFKTTWQKEVSFEEESKEIKNFFEDAEPKRITSPGENSEIAITSKALIPEIREVDVSEIKGKLELEENKIAPAQNDGSETSKRDWL